MKVARILGWLDRAAELLEKSEHEVYELDDQIAEELARVRDDVLAARASVEQLVGTPFSADED